MSATQKQTSSLLPLMGLDRLKNLSDGIFAFSMTMLILGIHKPAFPGDITDTELLKQLAAHWHAIVTYIISFLNIGSYWMLHHSVFSNLLYTNRTLVQLNLLFLLTVTFLPYPTALHGEYGRQSAVALVYGITIAVNYAMLFIVAWYAYRHPQFINPEFHLSIKKPLAIRLLLPLALAIIGTTLSFYFTRLSFLFFAFIPLSNVIPPSWLLSKQAEAVYLDSHPAH